MRISMLGWEFPPFKAGGLGVHCFELTRELIRGDVEIDFYMPFVGMDIPSHSDKMRIHQVRSRPDFGPYDSPPSDFFGAVREYNKNVVDAALKRPMDLIHAHDWLTYMAAVDLKRITGKPTVVTVHSSEWDRTGGNPSEWIFGIEKAGMEAADLVITVSRRMKHNLANIYGIDPSKIWVVYNGVNTSKLKLKKERGLYGKKVVLYLGRLTIQKNPEAFLKAAARVLSIRRDVQFILCGTGDMMNYLIDRSIEMGISENVTFTGFVSDEEVHWLYSIANVFVLPAVSEPFGITVLEAMGSGAPVIISKQVGVGEVLRHVLKVDFWDSDDLAQKILGILEYSPLVEELSSKAIIEAEGFTWEKTAQETLFVYSAALSGKKAPPEEIPPNITVVNEEHISEIPPKPPEAVVRIIENNKKKKGPSKKDKKTAVKGRTKKGQKKTAVKGRTKKGQKAAKKTKKRKRGGK